MKLEMRESEKVRTAGGFFGHTEDGEAVGALDVEDVSVLRVRDVWVVVPWNLLQNLAGDGTGVGGCRRELRKHHRSPRYQSVQYRHRTGS